MPDRRIFLGAAVSVAALSALVGYGVWSGRANIGGTAYAAPGLSPMTADAAALEFHRLAPALLLQVYTAFGRSDEAEIYDTLATVADGAALETLYLQRVGAMAGGGLDQSDQTIHEMNMTGLELRRRGETLLMDAEWEVIGVVGHNEHQHVRGNTYRADLTIAPADGAWKITGFELREVDRSNAGQLRETQE